MRRGGPRRSEFDRRKWVLGRSLDDGQGKRPGAADEQGESLRAVFVDANETLDAVFSRRLRAEPLPVAIHRDPHISPERLPVILDGAEIAVVDHTRVPTEVARQCPGLKHVVFLGTGARSYMDPEKLAELGIEVHTIKGYGDTAVAEATVALMWASAKGLCRMDREMRAGHWLRTDGFQLTGKTLGLIGFGGIAREVARIAGGSGLRVLAWNRTPTSRPSVEFVSLDTLLEQSDVVSLHLQLVDETRGFLSRERLAALRDGAILINTARGALVDEAAMIEALQSGRLAHAGLDVFDVEPLPSGHPLTRLPNVTLSAHSAFRTPEASDNLARSALSLCRQLSAAG